MVDLACKLFVHIDLGNHSGNTRVSAISFDDGGTPYLEGSVLMGNGYEMEAVANQILGACHYWLTHGVVDGFEQIDFQISSAQHARAAERAFAECLLNHGLGRGVLRTGQEIARSIEHLKHAVLDHVGRPAQFDPRTALVNPDKLFDGGRD